MCSSFFLKKISALDARVIKILCIYLSKNRQDRAMTTKTAIFNFPIFFDFSPKIPLTLQNRSFIMNTYVSALYVSEC